MNRINGQITVTHIAAKAHYFFFFISITRLWSYICHNPSTFCFIWGGGAGLEGRLSFNVVNKIGYIRFYPQNTIHF